MVKGKTGRKPLNITVKNISDTLRSTRSIHETALALGCSRGYIYQEPKKVGANPREVMNESS